MKVYIGPYKSWIGPFQIADCLRFVGVSKDKCHEIGEKLSKTFIKDVCEWIYSKQKRKVKIKIHDYDAWNVDSTLALIILPLLNSLKSSKHGAPNVDDEDVPDHLKSTSAPKKENEYDIDENHFKRWDWVLDEMIWTFEQLQPDSDWESKYHSGDPDIRWIKVDTGFVNPDTGEKETISQMVNGENNTYKFDADGYKKHSARIERGCCLFGKYFRALWD